MKINSKFQEAFTSKNRYLLLIGGTGSGKSYFAGQKIVYRMMTESTHIFLVLRKYGTSLRNTVFENFILLIKKEGLEKDFSWTHAPLEIIYKLNGNKIIFSGVDDPERLKSLTGITGIFLEELTEFSHMEFKIIDIYLRGVQKSYFQLIGAFNPIDSRSWVKKEFFDQKNYVDSLIVHSTYKDNQFIDDNFGTTILNNARNDENYKDIYFFGKWGQLKTNTIFNNWTVNENISTYFKDYNNVYNGTDFGFSHASVNISVSEKDDNLYVFHEIYMKQTTNDKFIEKIKLELPNDQFFTCDSADPEFIMEMKNASLWANPAKKGDGSIRAGINWLKRKNIIIHPSCENTIREISTYSYIYNEKTDEIFEKPEYGNDDCMAALRYAIEPIRLTSKITACLSLF